MEAAPSFEALLPIYQSTRRHIPEDIISMRRKH